MRILNEGAGGGNIQENLNHMSPEEFAKLIQSDPEELGVHLKVVEHEIQIEDCAVSLHCHCMAVDGNGRVNPRLLAEFMRNAALDYAIPRSQVREAQERDLRHRNTRAISALHREAIGLFTDLAKSGEGGELLLFLLAEQYLGIPQVLSKMSLKTDHRHHYNGADGVYAMPTDTGTLKLFWGESKIYGDASDAIRDCLASLSPFLTQEESERADRQECTGPQF